MHIHSNHSSDGRQSLIEILNNTSMLGFDIIAITDHDSLSVYNELEQMIIKNELSGFPIVVTGIEHTVSYADYGEMCHVLKHFINPQNKDVLRDVNIVEKSFWNRAKIQLERIEYCQPLKNIMNQNGISVCFEEFVEYLKENNIKTPDYSPLIKYLIAKLIPYNVDFWELFESLKVENEKDPCAERREKKNKRYHIVETRFKNRDVYASERFLLSILAVRGVDDDIYPQYSASGSLSVNEYGQVNIFKLNSNGVTTFAHPTESAVETLLKCGEVGGGLVGIENNKKNEYVNYKRFETVKSEMNLVELRGSDAHECGEDVYEDLMFYDVSPNDLKKFINIVKNKMSEDSDES